MARSVRVLCEGEVQDTPFAPAMATVPVQKGLEYGIFLGGASAGLGGSF